MKTDRINGNLPGNPGAFLWALTGLALLVLSVNPLSAESRRNRDAELGALPPPPDLRQESDKSWSERMKDRRIAMQRKKAEEADKAKAAARRKAPKEEPASQRIDQRQRQKVPMPARNPNTGDPDFKTPSGYRLKSFNDPAFWEDEGAPPVEEHIASLPAMPDLRQNSQKSWGERRREKQQKINEVKEARKIAIAERAERERLGAEAARQKALEAANRPKPEPRTYYAYNGQPIQPETPTGHGLKGYNRDARYVQDQQVVYQGQMPESTGLKWLKKGADPQFNDLGPDDSKWKWQNPFSTESTRPDGGLEVTPVNGGNGVLEGDVSASDAVDPNSTLISSLGGIRIVPRTQAVSQGPMSGVTGIVNDGVMLPPKVAAVLEGYLGQSMSLASLNQMVREAIVAYRASDMPVVDVLVPEQEVTTGVLQLVVIEGRLGDVIVEGNEYTTSASLEREIRLQRDQIIRESVLLEDLAWINKNPFRSVDLIYSPGADYGSTDLILRTEEIAPLTFYMGYEDSGTELLGQDRVIAGVNWGGPLFFGTDSLVSYQFTSDLDDQADLRAHSGVWTSYLPWRHVLTVLGATVSSDAEIYIDGEKLNSGGTNRQLSGRYTIPLPAFSSFTQELELGADLKSSNSNLLFGGLGVFDTTTEIVQFGLGYNVIQRDRYGMTTLDTELIWSPGDMSRDNSDEIFGTQRLGASSAYLYGRARINRTIYLPHDWSLFGRVEGQLANSNLLASETLGAGGYDSVRGFEMRLVRGDQGIVGSLELRTPAMSFTQWSGFVNARDALVALAFYDFGFLQSSEPLPDEERRSLSSFGVGLRYQLDENLSVRLDYGWQVDEHGFEDGEDGRVHIGARASF